MVWERVHEGAQFPYLVSEEDHLLVPGDWVNRYTTTERLVQASCGTVIVTSPAKMIGENALHRTQ